MKDFIIGLVVTVILILLFSTACFPEDVFPLFGSISTDYPGDSGMIMPGGGADIAEVEQHKVNRTEIQEASESTDEAENEIQAEIETEIKMEVLKMGVIMLSFWHGVAAVLIGETAALMVATAYLKIRRANDGK